MPVDDLEIQREWDADPLRERWRATPDHGFVVWRFQEEVLAHATADGAGGLLLEVGAADAGNACRLIERGFAAAVALEPSPIMVAKARKRLPQYGARLRPVRGIAETLPFGDARFDCVLCDSALDHFADPERAIQEMARVTKPDGRVVIAFTNYAGLTSRMARVLYAVGRSLRVVAPETEDAKLPWDTPVPFEHSFECTLANVSAMAAPYLVLEDAVGVSLGWMLPGWGALLARAAVLRRALKRMDRVARSRPHLADLVVSVWRPRPVSTWPADALRVRPTNPVYARLIRSEAAFWEQMHRGNWSDTWRTISTSESNADLTGDPGRSWLDDLCARGPFTAAAILGCDEIPWDVEWLRRRCSARVDVFDLSPTVLDAVRRRLGELADRVRFVPCDLNFYEIPPATYDCIWSSGTLHLLSNLEHVVAQVHRALRPNGVFALHGWIGENRLQYDVRRLERINSLLTEVPAAYRRLDRVERPSASQLSSFAALRSEDVLPLLRSHPGFEIVHLTTGGYLFPLLLAVDLPALARDRPELVERLRAAEVSARRDGLRPGVAYVVLRRRD